MPRRAPSTDTDTDPGRVSVKKVRSEFVAALRNLEQSGVPLRDLITRELQADPIGTLRALSGFLPKEVEVTGRVEHTLTSVLREFEAPASRVTVEGEPQLVRLEDFRR